MKDKIFIFIICGFMFLFMIAAPIIFILSKAEIIKTENLGNVITAEKVYDNGSLFGVQLNAIENAKAKITDIYINYLPGYGIVVSEIGTLKVNINKPVYSMYSEITMKAAANVVTSMPADINTDSERDTESAAEISDADADSPSIGSPRPLGKLHTIDGAVFYGSSARMYGYYGYTDTFFFYDYELPEHEIETTQRYRGFQSNMSRYLSGDYSKSRDTDHIYYLFYLLKIESGNIQ